jgi:transposase
MKKDPIKELLELEYITGGTSIRKLAKKYGMSTTTVHRRLMSVKKGKRKKVLSEAAKQPKPGKEMPEDVKQLQEALYEAQLKISLLETMIDISDEQFGTDIKKKFGARQ